MARPMPTTVTCPNCGQPFNALLEQILDVGTDPSVKDRLLSNQINTVTCPHCGWNGQIGTPLVYHDPAKPLAIVHVPMQLNIDQTERERMVGQLTQTLMRTLPEDAPKGHLLQPQTALTMQGLIEQVLEADGITREMLDQERRKITLIDELLAAKGDEQQSLVDENIDLIDESFLELLRIVGERAGQTGDSRTSLRALNLRSKLIESTEAGQRVKVREEAYQQAELELNSIVTEEGHINREDFVDLIVDSADNPDKIQYLSSRIPQILDYTTFNILTNRIDATSDPDQRAQLQEARETMLKVAAEYEQASRAVVERAADTLRMLLSAPDVVEAIHQNLDRIDETFMQVLQVNLQEARQSGSVEVSARLKQIRDEVLRLVEQQAPPEIQLINQLLSEQDDNAALDLLASRADAVTPQLIEVMDQLIDQLNAVGNVGAAQRLAMLRNEANRML